MPANSSPNFTFGQIPSAGLWNSTFQEYVSSYSGSSINQAIINPTITGGVLQNVSIQGSNISGIVYQSYSPQSITATSGTILLASMFENRFILRSGPTAAFTDTTDTAANIIAAFPGIAVNDSIILSIGNFTGYDQTIEGGTGVTLSIISPQSVIIAPNNTVEWLAVINNITAGSQAITLYRIKSSGI
jgi:hypothetical protein